MKKILICMFVVIIVLTMGACTSQPVEKIESIEDLAGKTIGVQLGTTGDIYIAGDIEDGVFVDAKLERFNKGLDAVQALNTGKIDAVVIDDQPAKVFVEQNEGLEILETAYVEEDYAICIAKDNTDLKDQFNSTIAELKEDGTLQGLLDYYIEGKEGSKPYESPEGIEYDGTLTMATNAEFPPYEYHEGGEIIGLDVDFARAICDKLGKELVIEDMNFDSIIAAVQTGKADFGAAGLTVDEERLQSIDFTDTYCQGIQVVIVKK